MGYDEDNDVSSPFSLFLDVPVLSQTRLEFDYSTIPVHPTEITSVDFRLFNLGNGDIGYDLFLESHRVGMLVLMIYLHREVQILRQQVFMLEDGQMNIGISFTPPQVMTLAGAEMTVILRVVSQSEEVDDAI